MNQPYFSIICTTHNSSSFVANTLKSVINQSFNDIEIIIVDDGSTDNTIQTIRELSSNNIKIYKDTLFISKFIKYKNDIINENLYVSK